MDEEQKLKKLFTEQDFRESENGNSEILAQKKSLHCRSIRLSKKHQLHLFRSFRQENRIREQFNKRIFSFRRNYFQACTV